MNTITITRPKELLYAPRRIRGLADKIKLADQLIALSFSVRHEICGRAGLSDRSTEYTFLSSVVFAVYGQSGVDYYVNQEVSNALELSFAGKELTEINWPHNCARILWEDQSLPEVIVSRTEDDKLLLIVLPHQDGDETELCYHVTMSALKEFLLTGNWSCETGDAAGSSISEYMTILWLKVVAYMQTEHFVVSSASSKSEKKLLGFHPKHYTKESIQVVRFAPSLHKITENIKSSGTDGSKHSFYGRAGHIRRYRANRYTNMRGRWQWIPPIIPPKGISVKYVVRKPKDALAALP